MASGCHISLITQWQCLSISLLLWPWPWHCWRAVTSYVVKCPSVCACLTFSLIGLQLCVLGEPPKDEGWGMTSRSGSPEGMCLPGGCVDLTTWPGFATAIFPSVNQRESWEVDIIWKNETFSFSSSFSHWLWPLVGTTCNHHSVLCSGGNFLLPSLLPHLLIRTSIRISVLSSHYFNLFSSMLAAKALQGGPTVG
jgi:hypothetical protein